MSQEVVASNRRRCIACGLEYDQGEHPTICPHCGADQDEAARALGFGRFTKEQLDLALAADKERASTPEDELELAARLMSDALERHGGVEARLVNIDVLRYVNAVERHTDEHGTVDKDALAAYLGADNVDAALRLHDAVMAKLAELSGPLVLVPSAEPPRRPAHRSVLTEAEATAVAMRIAWESDVDFASVAAKQQGVRASEHAKVKRVRARIAERLHQLGASNRVIGRVLGGRSGEAVRLLIESAKRDRLQQLAELWHLPPDDRVPSEGEENG